MTIEETANDEVTEVVEPEAPNEEVEDTPTEEPATETEVATEAEDPDLIELSDGTKVTAEELVKGYLRQSDYTRKTQELASERKRVEDLAGVVSKAKPVDEPMVQTQAKKYKPEQLNELKEVLGELGYVSKHELSAMTEKQKREEIVNSFFTQHPEYSQENDPGDVKISAFRKELSLYNHNDLNVLPKALAKAHEAVSGAWASESEKAKIIAAKVKGKSATVGSGGGSQKAPESANKRYTRAQIQAMQEMGVYENEEPID